MLAGFIIGIALFYEIGFFIMIPLVFTVAASTGLSLFMLDCRCLHLFRNSWVPASLSCTYCFKCNVQCPSGLHTTSWTGHSCAYHTCIRTLPGYIAQKGKVQNHYEFVNQKVLSEEGMPGILDQFVPALLPVILITSGTIAGFSFLKKI